MLHRLDFLQLRNCVIANQNVMLISTPVLLSTLELLLPLKFVAGVGNIPQPPKSPFQSPSAATKTDKAEAACTEGAIKSPVPAAASASALTQPRSSSKRKQYTGCALAIVGLQRLPNKQGTGKQIVDSVAAAPELAQHLNWCAYDAGNQ